MSQTQIITKIITDQGILPLYFHPDEKTSLDVLKCLYDAGIRAVEYTNRGEAAYRNFKQLVDLRNQSMPELKLGIGTIKNLPDAKKYVEAATDFLVSPGWVPEVAEYALQNDLFYAPGCMTPSEIIAAENKGIRFIKLFPGNLLGPEFMSTIREIFPSLLFMPTGGVDTTTENIEAWFAAGVSAVGMGSKLISKKLMEARDYAAIASATQNVLEIIRTIRIK